MVKAALFAHAGAGEAHLPVNTDQHWKSISMTIFLLTQFIVHCVGRAVCKCNIVTPTGHGGEGGRVIMFSNKSRELENKERGRETGD